jgi:hypothetical protein
MTDFILSGEDRQKIIDAQETTMAALERIEIDTKQLRKDLAEREAEIAKLRDYLHELACLGNGDIYGNSIGNCLAREALSTPPSTSYLEQWEKEKYGEPVAWIRFRSDGCYEGPIMDSQIEDVRKHSGVWKPLYARKD